MDERRIPVGQGNRNPGAHGGAFPGSQNDVLGGDQVRSRVPRVGVAGQREVWVESSDLHPHRTEDRGKVTHNGRAYRVRWAPHITQGAHNGY